VDIGTHLLLYGQWEPNYTLAFRNLLRPGDVVLDIGANHGYYALVSVPHIQPTGHVYAFEPNRNFCKLIQGSISVNGYDQWITLEHSALSEAAGQVELVFDLNWSGGGHLSNEAPPGPVEDSPYSFQSESVSCIAGDDYFEGKVDKVDVIKMDVEGAEGLVLSGMARIIDRSPTLKIMMEWCPRMLDRYPRNTEFVASFLASRGFHCWKIGSRGELIPAQWEKLKGETNLVQNLMLCRQQLIGIA
jgi:FkbM family methyltransferase